MTRKTTRYFKLLRLLGLLVLSLLTPAAAAQGPAPFDPRFGVVDSFVNTAEANAAGAGWTRVFFRWDVVQPAGAFDWKPTNVPDPLLDAEIAAGREVVAVLIGTPAWATSQMTSTAVPPLDVWGDFVFKIATQYKGRVKHWVIWNQPDVNDPTSPGHTWDGSEEDYYRLLKEAYLKIKAVDPSMQVHLAGLTYTWDYNRNQKQYLARLLDIIKTDPQAAGENHYFDAVSYHVYYSPRQMLDILTDARSILDSYGLGNKPIWINETNAPPSEDYIESDIVKSPFKITLEEQGAYVIQAFALGLAGGAERIAFFKLRSERAGSEVEPYGLLRSDGSRRPVFKAFRTITTYLAGAQKVSWLQLGSVYAVTMDRGGQTTTVLWNTATAATRFNLNAISPQALLVDERGGQETITATNDVYLISLPGAFCSNKPDCFIGGAPRLVVEAGSPDQRAPSLPVLTPTPTATPLPVTPTVAVTPTPTLVAAPPTLTPMTMPSPTAALAATRPVSATMSAPPAAAVLPDEDVPAPAPGQAAAKSTAVPPVTLSTVMTPHRILWLLIIGLIVFVVSYGIQVVIWYRARR